MAPLLGDLVTDSVAMAVNARRADAPTLVTDSVAMAVNARRADAPTVAKVGASLWLGHLLQPHRLLPAGLAILSAPPTVPVLQRIAHAGVPVAVLHGLSDPVVSLPDAVSTRDLTHGRLLVVEPTRQVASGHSWLLEHCRTLDEIMTEALLGPLGALLRKELIGQSLNPRIATQATIEGSTGFYASNARILHDMPALRLHQARHLASRRTMSAPWRHYETAA